MKKVDSVHRDEEKRIKADIKFWYRFGIGLLITAILLIIWASGK